MGKYNEKKDECLWEKTVDCGMFNIVVGVYSYDGGAAKLQISRVKLDERGSQYSKLGRMSFAEITVVLPVVQEAMGHMGKQKDGNKDSDLLEARKDGEDDDDA